MASLMLFTVVIAMRLGILMVSVKVNRLEIFFSVSVSLSIISGGLI